MNITISGGSKKLYDLAHSIVDYCGKTILSKQLYNTISVDVEFDKNLHKESGVLGEVDFDDKNHKPREFTITIDCTVSKRRIMESIAHEMVHVKQWICGEMYEYVDPNVVRFMKKKVDISNMDYYDYPWEIEAFGRQLGLFIHWCEVDGLGDREDMREVA